MVVWDTLVNGQHPFVHGVEGQSIFGQLFDGSGAALGDRITIVTYPEGSHGENPLATAIGPKGDFVVTWTADNADGYEHEAYARYYDPGGSPIGGAMRLNVNRDGNQYNWSQYASSDARGQFVAVTSSRGLDGQSSTLNAQVLTTTPVCADADDDDEITAVDALIVLKAAVLLTNCHPCLCDTNGNSNVRATDALIVLRKSVGLSASLDCLPC